MRASAIQAPGKSVFGLPGILLPLFFCLSISAAEPLLEKTILFTERSDGFTLYRIPGIVVTARGSVLAYCEARKFSDADRGEIEIQLRRSTDGGQTFSAAKQVAHMGPRLPRNPHMPSWKQGKDMGGPDEQTVNNPVAISARDGSVHLLYCVEYMRAFHLRSDDDGVTWSAPQEVTTALDDFRGELDWQAIATGPGHAVEMRCGRLCVPFWMANYEKTEAAPRKKVGTIISDDGGTTWRRGGIAIPDAGEPNIALLSDGDVLLTARNSHNESRRLVTRSADGATNWSTPVFVDELLEPGCMAGITAHPGTSSVKGPLLLFSHPHTTDREHAARRDVTIHLSHDNGQTWPLSKMLQAGPSAYSDLAVLPDGTDPWKRRLRRPHFHCFLGQHPAGKEWPIIWGGCQRMLGRAIFREETRIVCRQLWDYFLVHEAPEGISVRLSALPSAAVMSDFPGSTGIAGTK